MGEVRPDPHQRIIYFQPKFEIILITEIQIENYKSIEKLTLPLGRVNVFIGENGAGKSNILEIIALAGAASANKLDNEFLTSRGIRVTNPEHMRQAFSIDNSTRPISIITKNNIEDQVSFILNNDNLPYSKWKAEITPKSAIRFDMSSFQGAIKEFSKHMFKEIEDKGKAREITLDFLEKFTDSMKITTANINEKKSIKKKNTALTVTFESDEKNDFARFLSNSSFNKSALSTDLSNFIIYSPENSSLRIFQKEGQIEPLGINGEGVLKLLSVYCNSEDHAVLVKIKKSLKMLGWFEDLQLLDQSKEARLEIRDRYLAENSRYFDYTSANEGFFFLLFYFLLFNSNLTPSFFAIDNIDASLNPKLCENLILELVKLSKENNKQAILTTHNPSILDGLNLDDDEQRLFVISRGRSGSTKIKRIMKPTSTDGSYPYRLSELFLRGILGGLPKGF